MQSYVIRQARTFFHKPTSHSLVAGEFSGNAARFESPAAARQAIDALQSQTHHQKHDEYGVPTYKVVKAGALPQFLKAYL